MKLFPVAARVITVAHKVARVFIGTELALIATLDGYLISTPNLLYFEKLPSATDTFPVTHDAVTFISAVLALVCIIVITTHDAELLAVCADDKFSIPWRRSTITL